MSTIRFDRIEWGNAFSYGPNNVIELSAERVTQIVGKNGAGKSSIPLLLEEGTYNKNSKGFKKSDIPNRHLEEPYYIYTDFYVDKDSYRLEVNKSKTLKATMLKNGEDISAHTGSQTIKLFEELTGLNFKTFSQLFYQSTESSLEFLTATDSKRKEFLIQLFDQTEYGEKYVKFNDTLKNLNKEMTSIEGGINVARSQLSKIESQVNITVGSKKEEPEFPEDIVEEIAVLKNRIDSIEETNKKKAAENKVLTQLSSLRSKEEIQAAIDEIGTIESDSEFVQKLGMHNAKTSSAKAVIAKVEKVSDECPTCMQPVDVDFITKLKNENNEIIASNRDEAKAAIAKIEEIKEKNRLKKVLRNELLQRENLEARKGAETYQELEDLEDLEEKVSTLNSDISKIKAEIAEVRAHNQQVSTNATKKKSAEDSLDDTNKELEILVGKLGDIEQKIGPLETLKKAFSPTGLVAYKLENRVKDLEGFTNQYLGRLSDGRFNLLFALEKDKLNVVILDDGVEVPITVLSSGERARVVISTLLGIRSIMQKISKTTMNILFLDEVISVMDDAGKEQLVEVLLDETELNTFLVSHSWTHPLVTKLIVENTDGISKIRRD